MYEKTTMAERSTRVWLRCLVFRSSDLLFHFRLQCESIKDLRWMCYRSPDVRTMPRKKVF